MTEARAISVRIAAAMVMMIAIGCVSVDRDALEARNALMADAPQKAIVWSESLANDSSYSANLGYVEAGRVRMLTGDFVKAEGWFRKAIDSAVDRKERAPKIGLSDVANDVMASTITDDRTREYYLSPYEINLALGYGIIAQAVNGKREDALADARLAVYLQDNLATTYGVDIKREGEKNVGAGAQVYADQARQMQDVMEGTRNSWENAVLWYLTGVLFEADGDVEMAWQSYRKARAVNGECAVFVRAANRADGERRSPDIGKARLVVLYEDGLVPMREALKVPVPIYTAMSIDIPVYQAKQYTPVQVAISGQTNLVSASPAVNVRALAYRDLDEHLPGIIARNITRAMVQAGAQAAVNCSNGNSYAQLAVFLGNAVISCIRSADTRSWVTLPEWQYVWDEGTIEPGNYQIGIVANSRTISVPISLNAGETVLLWAADYGTTMKTALARL